MALKAHTSLTYRSMSDGLVNNKFDKEIVDLLVQENPILDDMVVVEANDGSSEKVTMRTGVSSATWTAFYEGVQASHGSRRQVRNTSGRLRTKIEVDADLFDSSPDKNAVLLDEVADHAGQMGQEMADCLFYGKIESEPRKFNGLINIYDTLGGSSSTDDRVSKHYVFNGKSASQASTAMLRSIWLIGWGSKSIRAFYPQMSKAGLDRGQWKKVDAEDGITTGATLELYRQYMTWQLGLSVRDFRYGARLANVQADEMFDSSGIPDYLSLLRRMVTRVKSDGVNQAWYMDKLTLEAVQEWLAAKTQTNALTYQQVQQRMTPVLFGIPVRTNDALNTNEDEVTA